MAKSSTAIAILALGASALAGPAALAQEAPAPGPRLVFDNKLQDFGEVYQGRVLRFIFRFKNLGDAPLEIKAVKSTCGCAVLTRPEAPVAPGAESAIEVEYDSTRQMGMQDLQLFVISNDKSQRDQGPFVTRLVVRGEVLSLYALDPPVAAFGRLVRGGEGRVLEARVSAGARPFKILALESSPACVKPSWAPDPKGGYTLRLAVSADATPGRVDDFLILKTDLARQPRLLLRVVGAIDPPIVFDPTASMPRGRRGDSASLVVERLDGRTGLDVLAVDYDRRRFQLTRRPTEPGRRLDLVLTIREDAPFGPFAGRVVLDLDVPEQPRLVVVVTGNIQPSITTFPEAVLIKGPVKKGQELARIEVMGAGAELAAAVAGAPASASIERAGGRVFVRVQADADAPASAFAKGALTLKSPSENPPPLAFIVAAKK